MCSFPPKEEGGQRRPRGQYSAEDAGHRGRDGELGKPGGPVSKSVFSGTRSVWPRAFPPSGHPGRVCTLARTRSSFLTCPGLHLDSGPTISGRTKARLPSQTRAAAKFGGWGEGPSHAFRREVPDSPIRVSLSQAWAPPLTQVWSSPAP